MTLLDDTTIHEATTSSAGDPPLDAGAIGSSEAVFGYDDCGTGSLLDAARELHAAMSSVHAQLLAVIGALGARDDEQVFEGFVLVDWLVVHLGLSRDTARKWADAAAVLRHLPATSALAATGAISWDKLRQATRFAEPCDDAVLADELPRWNEAQLRQLANERCRRVRDDTPEDTPRLGFRADRHGRGKYINGWLPNDEAAAVEAALERRAGQMGPEPDTKRWAPLLERLARALAEQSAASLAHDADLDRATVVIHVDDDVLAGIIAGNALIPTGTPISAEAARLAACDGRVQFVTEINGVAVGIGDAAQAVPRWLRRQVERRDGRCRCCGRHIHQIHHIHHWVKGGPTDLDNLVSR